MTVLSGIIILLILVLVLLIYGAVKLVKWVAKPSDVWVKNGNMYVTHGKLSEKDKKKIRDL